MCVFLLFILFVFILLYTARTHILYVNKMFISSTINRLTALLIVLFVIIIYICVFFLNAKITTTMTTTIGELFL